MQIGEIHIPINYCSDVGIYLRWYYNGWHYWLFSNDYQISLTTESKDIITSQLFSRISKIERLTGLKAEYSYIVSIEGIPSYQIPGFVGLLLAEHVEQYENETWYEVEITRDDHLIQEITDPAYRFEFEITRKELPGISTIYRQDVQLYVNDILCDIDEDEVIAITKQTNDIADMQDRQGDISAEFKIRKTREMRELFELSGESGIITDFPYIENSCRLVQDGIEMIKDGILILERTDDYYYYVSILSGNLNFFKKIENLKINDLTLASTNHNWNAIAQAASNAGEMDYVYPLCEPSDDGGMCRLTDSGANVNLYGGWVWCFVKVKAIWDEIFSNAGYICQGDILTEDKFLKLFMPITNLSITKEYTNQYLWSLYWIGNKTVTGTTMLNFPGTIVISGSWAFGLYGYYTCFFTATHKIQVVTNGLLNPVQELKLMLGAVELGTFELISEEVQFTYYVRRIFEIEYDATAGNNLWISTDDYLYFYYSITITAIENAQIGYSSDVVPRLHLPDLSQTEFIKMICNMFGLIPETTPRDKKIIFWNYLDLYDNVSRARDWSSYLSELDNEIEYKFGDYAQNNFLKYKESEDVLKGNGDGKILIEDLTLPKNKDVVELPVSTCDEVLVLTDENTSRLNMNKYDNKEGKYIGNDKMDARIVYVSRSGTLKTFGISDSIDVDGIPDGNIYPTLDPKIASSYEIAFPQLIGAAGYRFGYAGLSRLLTKTNVLNAKFNLPVYEVAGLKHYIPIYLSQYKAYFYVNKISNYVSGKLCNVELIKL